MPLNMSFHSQLVIRFSGGLLCKFPNSASVMRLHLAHTSEHYVCFSSNSGSRTAQHGSLETSLIQLDCWLALLLERQEGSIWRCCLVCREGFSSARFVWSTHRTSDWMSHRCGANPGFWNITLDFHMGLLNQPHGWIGPNPSEGAEGRSGRGPRVWECWGGGQGEREEMCSSAQN